MGQAKSRGSREQRIEAAVALQEALKPTEMICNECGGSISGGDIYMQNTRNMPGVDMACSGVCPQCKSVTWGFKGTEQGVAALSAAIASEHPDVIGSVQAYTNKS